MSLCFLFQVGTVRCLGSPMYSNHVRCAKLCNTCLACGFLEKVHLRQFDPRRNCIAFSVAEYILAHGLLCLGLLSMFLNLASVFAAESQLRSNVPRCKLAPARHI